MQQESNAVTIDNMWNGSFSPNMQKRKLPFTWVWFDASNVSDDTLENIDPDSDKAEGVLNVQLTNGGKVYRFNASYQDFLDFEDTGFDTAWLAGKGVAGPGGWGWPFGRTTHTGGRTNS